MGNYKLRDEAEADLIRIHQWGVRHHGEEQADRYFAAFFDHFEQIAERPLLYPVSDIREGYRRSVCGKDSIFYRIDGETVEIMAVIGQQDADQWL
ncbi:MAG: type II toxin-antitoxin system RelE/ParE family toxin [Gammaproteobacteria bacterium]|nr:type II toxin-antitoxin system RelE/ParE family toxin [Gammaproteobacteria bacterium]MCP4981057.1 type II toxin-antitoxin system RelE/ParE family toxin [Gammaproteobacteria bacterium]